MEVLVAETVKLSGVEAIKAGSRGLRGTVAEELATESRGGLTDAAYNLLKFHGSYEQYDRDTATARKLGNEAEFELRFDLEDRPGNNWSGYAFTSREGGGESASHRPVLLIVESPN